MLIAPNTPNIGFVSQNGIKASPYIHTPPAKFAMSAQNARYFNQKLPGGGGGGGNGGGGSGIGGGI